MFALEGDLEMRELIFDYFLNHPFLGDSNWLGYKQIIELDGLKGLFFIAERFGQEIEKGTIEPSNDWIVFSFQEKNPQINVLAELEKEANSNSYIRIYIETLERYYLTGLDQNNTRSNNIDSVEHKFNDIVDEILENEQFLKKQRIKNLSEDEIFKVAVQLSTETKLKNIEKLLHIFEYHMFPLDCELLIKFAKRKKTIKNSIVEIAITALKQLRSYAIREFVFEKIEKSKNYIEYLEILVSNYIAGDFKILTQIVEKTKADYKIENLAVIYCEIYTFNKTKECKEPLEAFYSKLNCGFHRNEIINILLDNDVLSDKIKNEMKYDSFLENRHLIK